METVREQSSRQNAFGEKRKNYNEVIEFFEANWSPKGLESLDTIKKLDIAFGNPSQYINSILIGGTNGKGLTIHFLEQLLKEEGLSVGVFSSPHRRTYNERCTINGEMVTNDIMTNLSNEVFTVAQQEKLELSTAELLTMTALLHFKKANVDVALLEVSNITIDPVMICNPKVMAITRITEEKALASDKALKEQFSLLTQSITDSTWVVSADQSKLNLKVMSDTIQEKGGHWAMPIRKLVPLAYPFEQLHGRAAALAERTAQLYVKNFIITDDTIVTESLLIKPKGTRGRPTTEAKQKADLNPRRSLEQFWQEKSSSPNGRFQLFEKEKPGVLLDNASNMDALKNLLLGIRLLHYQRPIKGVALILGCYEGLINRQEFIKATRYFFKKTSGTVILYPLAPYTSPTGTLQSWDVDQIANDVKNVKIKAHVAKDLESALEYGQKHVDERSGLIVISGSNTALAEYWKLKDSTK